MENISSKNIIYQYGLLTSLVSISWEVVKFSMGAHYENDTVSTVVGTIILIAGIVLAQLAFRKANGGFVEYTKCLKIGVGVGVVVALIGVIYHLIFINFVEPDFFDKVLEISYNNLMEDNREMVQGTALQQFVAASDWVTKFTPLFIIAFTLFFSFIFSLCTGIIIKRKAD